MHILGAEVRKAREPNERLCSGTEMYSLVIDVACLPAKLPFVCVCVCLCLFVCYVLFLRAVISVLWPFCPVEHFCTCLILFVPVLLVICGRLCSQINDDDVKQLNS